jgi:hypothetical protein
MAETPLGGGGVLLRHGFDHAVSPDLLAGSFDGWSQLRAQGRAFRSDLAGSYDLWYLLRYDAVAGLTALPLRWQPQPGGD